MLLNQSKLKGKPKMIEKPKLSKCIIIKGKEVLKDLGIEFEDLIVERAERTSEILKIKGKENGKQTTN